MIRNAFVNAGFHRPFQDAEGRSCILNAQGQRVYTNTPAMLRYDEWKDIDRTVIGVAVDRLVAYADLMSKGLVHPLGSIGETISLYQRSSDITGANVSMSGVTRGEKDKINFDYKSIPVPIFHKDFEVNIRLLEASRKFGTPLDTMMAEMAARVVAEKSEDVLFAGHTTQVDGAVIYGFNNHPDRNTVSMSTVWTSATGAQILAQVQSALQALRNKRMFGPYTMYIPGAFEGTLDNDFNSATSDTRTVRQRLLQLEGLTEIKVADRQTASTVTIVQMTKDVVDLAVAQDITTVQWQEQGGMQSEFKVMACWAPRVKSTYDGQCGVAVIS